MTLMLVPAVQVEVLQVYKGMYAGTGYRTLERYLTDMYASKPLYRQNCDDHVFQRNNRVHCAVCSISSKT